MNTDRSSARRRTPAAHQLEVQTADVNPGKSFALSLGMCGNLAVLKRMRTHSAAGDRDGLAGERVPQQKQ